MAKAQAGISMVSGVIRKAFPAKIGARVRKMPARFPAAVPKSSFPSCLPAKASRTPERIAPSRTARG
jgi:hypothetical protein